MSYFIYIVVRICIAILSIIPLSILQTVSKGIAWLLRVVMRYRVDLVEQHLATSFPGKSPIERDRITKDFYLNLSDTLVETLKGYSMSDKALMSRFTLNNVSLLDQNYDEGRSVIGIGGHFGNWEWGSASFSHAIKHHVVLVVGDITNSYLDDYITKKRTSEQVTIIKTREIISAIRQYKDRPSLFILVADQCPSNVKHAYWTDFLNRDTPFIHSPEKLAKKYDLPCVYLPLKRTKRAHYQVDISPLDGDSITQAFVDKLEATIRAIPEQWLWTHRRWKRQHMKPKTEL